MAWVYEQKFNELNDGDLNGQDSWVAHTDLDVQTSVVFEGAKAVSAYLSGLGYRTGTRSFTGINAGIVYVAIRMANINQGAARVGLWEGTNILINVQLSYTDQIRIQDYGVGWVNLMTYAANQWYVLAIEFDDVAQSGKYRVNIHNGVSWSGWSDWYATNGAYSVVDKIEIRLDCEADTADTAYWDTITPTNPFAPVGPPPLSHGFIF